MLSRLGLREAGKASAGALLGMGLSLMPGFGSDPGGLAMVAVGSAGGVGANMSLRLASGSAGVVAVACDVVSPPSPVVGDGVGASSELSSDNGFVSPARDVSRRGGSTPRRRAVAGRAAPPEVGSTV